MLFLANGLNSKIWSLFWHYSSESYGLCTSSLIYRISDSVDIIIENTLKIEDFFSYSIEYRVKKGEFRAIKAEYRVIKVEYRVMRVEYRVIKVEYHFIKSEYRVIKSEYRVIKSEYRVIKSEYRVIKQNKKTIGCSTRSHTWRSHEIKKTYF